VIFLHLSVIFEIHFELSNVAIKNRVSIYRILSKAPLTRAAGVIFLKPNYRDFSTRAATIRKTHSR